jgi:hypothetical protein
LYARLVSWSRAATRRVAARSPRRGGAAWRRHASCLVLGLATVFANAAHAPFASAAPSQAFLGTVVDPDHVDFSLLTIGLGDDLASRFGHTGLRVVDRDNGMDVVFNWGMFSFEDPLFAWHFFRGELDYHMGVATFGDDMRWHASERRRVDEAKLNLTAAQKGVLLARVAWNTRRENRYFRYQYWYKNCATIPRDYLDEALGGRVKQRFETADANGRRFRDYVRSNLAFMPFVAPSLEMIMNGNIDRPISVWEDMFLPARLRDHLAELPALDDAGAEIPGRKLLGPSTLLLDFPEEYAAPVPDYAVLAAPLVLALIAFAGALVLRRGRASSAALRALGFGVLYWGIFSGVFGLTLTLDWFASGHPDTWHNANLLFVWPLDFVFIGWGLRLVRGRAMPDRLFGTMHGVSAYLVLHGLLLVAGVAASRAGVLQQDLSRTGLWFGLPAALTWLAFGVFGVARAPRAATVAAPSPSVATAGELATRRR